MVGVRLETGRDRDQRRLVERSAQDLEAHRQAGCRGSGGRRPRGPRCPLFCQRRTTTTKVSGTRSSAAWWSPVSRYAARDSVAPRAETNSLRSASRSMGPLSRSRRRHPSNDESTAHGWGRGRHRQEGAGSVPRDHQRQGARSLTVTAAVGVLLVAWGGHIGLAPRRVALSAAASAHGVAARTCRSSVREQALGLARQYRRRLETTAVLGFATLSSGRMSRPA
jgi:hypothetical protein